MASKGSRRAVLLRSLRSVLDDGERVANTAMVFSRHPLATAFAVASAIGVFAVAAVSGVEPFANQLIMGGAGAAVALVATTEWRVLVLTDRGLALCRSSRIRQVARSIERRWAAAPTIARESGNLITSEWRVGRRLYTTTRRWEADLYEIERWRNMTTES